MTITRTFRAPGQITFDIQQTEDNVFIFEIGDEFGMYSPGWIVGTGLRQESYNVPAGTYEICFGSYNVGVFGEPFSLKDSLFIDNISFPIQPFEETAVAAYQAPLVSLGLEGTALTIVASGFLNPNNNSQGEYFVLWVALAAGGDLIPLPLVTTTGFDENLLSENLDFFLKANADSISYIEKLIITD